jgi:hypothetical protein
MLRKFKFNFQEKYKSSEKIAKIIVTDMSWYSIHAVLEIVNNEDFFQYRVWKLANDGINEAEEPMSSKSWLASCASHTMHRFSVKSSQFFVDKTIQGFAIFCFALLLSATSIVESNSILSKMCNVFLCKDNGDVAPNSLARLDDMLRSRDQQELDVEKYDNTMQSMEEDQDEDN